MNQESTGLVSIQNILNTIERVICFISLASAWVFIPIMILVRSFDIVARQFFSTPSNYFQFVEWRAFMFLVLLGLGHAYLSNAHVRIDIIHSHITPRTRGWIEAAGFLLAIVPFCAVLIWYGGEFSYRAYENGEREVIAFGLPVRWMINAILPVGGLLLLISGAVVFIRNVLFLLGRSGAPSPEV